MGATRFLDSARHTGRQWHGPNQLFARPL